MRKIFATVLILTMFASALICGCDHEAFAGVGETHHSHQVDGDHHGKGGSLLQDCQKADMQLPSHMDVSQPDLKNALHLAYLLPENTVIRPLGITAGRQIRGPPPWDDLDHAQSSILLTTQRLRI